MKMLNPRYAFASLAISGIAAGASLFGTGIASADMIGDLSPLLTSQCSFTQIDAAIHAELPEMAARLDASPMQKGMLKMAYEVAPEMRANTLQQLVGQKLTNGLDQAMGESPDLGAKMGRVGATCDTYAQ
ncbi:hemophore-related protein [Nocardia colli]|uniref:Hemophore-related protein n=1 Tax=Nocardia colli TaxID=2545717 RepID=A0A5N0EBR2_9NOCA|nr:hemophore-related protein [Nocardia colli]KAA8886838.1 hemophore-related protein [Nocardia colli]